MKAKLLKDIVDDDVVLAKAGRVLDLIDTNTVAIDTQEYGGEIWVEVQGSDIEIIPDLESAPGEPDDFDAEEAQQ